jgi:amino acid permease
MLREMDFVEGDWAALFWALGSAIALFRHFEAPMSQQPDILSRTQALMKKVKKRTLTGYVVCFVLVASFGSIIFIFPNPFQRLGSGLTVIGILYLAYQLHERRNRKLPSEIKSLDCAAFYRTELERQRDFHRGAWFWSRLIVLVPGYILFLVGFAIAYPELKRLLSMIGACFIALCIVAIPLNLRLSRKYQRQIDELDSLPKQP